VAGEVLRIDDELVVRRIADDAFVVTHEPFFASNTLAVRMPDGTVVLCSSPFETQATRALVRWVQGAFRPARIVAINTHFHFDGTGGNEAYRELGVETWGSALTRKLLLEKGARLQAGSADDFEGPRRQRVLAMKVVPAAHTFAEDRDLTLTFGGAEVRVIYPGAAHSPDNLVVFFPSNGVLFGGCMIKGSRSVGFIGHADLDHWEAAVDVTRKVSPTKVVPGHGAVGGPELFDLTVDVVREARARHAGHP
jgi:glyoxylase-like metal-dependent hydrolase (beta-lactamase superfamily II)